MRIFVLTMALGLLAGGEAYAADGCAVPATCEKASCCPDPGCCQRCGGQMICKLVPEVREIKKTVWVVKCEPYCLPLPRLVHGPCPCGDPGCGGCDTCCRDGTCGSCKACCDPCKVEQAKCHVPPKCPPPRIRKTLERKEVTCKVCCYKCVPVCCQCCTPGAPITLSCCTPACCNPCVPTCEQEDCTANAAPGGRTGGQSTDLIAPLPPILGASLKQSTQSSRPR